MSKHIVKEGESLWSIYADAKKSDNTLSWNRFKKANRQLLNKTLYAGMEVTVPVSKAKTASLHAAPKEGKCGNECTFNPRGDGAKGLNVKMRIGGRLTPALEPEQTYILGKGSIDESQKGPVTITVNGKEHTVIRELAEFKKGIARHKDIKIELTVIDKDVLKPAGKVPTPVQEPKSGAGSVDMPEFDRNAKPQFQPPENFESSDNAVTMTYREMAIYNRSTISTAEILGFRDHDTIYVSEVKSCSIAENTTHHIKEVDDETQIEVLRNLTNNFYIGSVGIPSALAAKDLLSKPNRLILIDHFLNKGWDGKFIVTSAKTGGQLIILKGWPGARRYLDMTRIKASNKKVGTLGIAAGAATGEKVALAEASGVFGAGSKMNILFILGFETTKWFLSEDHWNNKSDLFISLGTTTVKFAVAGVVAAVAGGIIFSTAGAIILTAIIGGVIIGVVLDWADNNWGITDSFKKGWNENIEPKLEKAEEGLIDIFEDFTDTVSRGGIR